MRALKSLLIILLAVVALGLILGLSVPKHSTVSRSAVVYAPVALVYDHVKSLQNMAAWSPWDDKDPNIKATYAGDPGTVGSSSSWEGNTEVGKGKQEIIALVPDRHVGVKLDLLEPVAAEASLDLYLEAMRDSTVVTWTYGDDNDLLGRIYLVFNDMDAMIGPDIEKGVRSLKVISEADASARAAAIRAKTYGGYTIETVERPAMVFVGKRAMVKWDKLGAFFMETYPKVSEAVTKQGLSTLGEPSALFYKWDDEGKQADVYAGIPVAASADTLVPGWKVLTVPGGKALMTAHFGAYEKTEAAHAAMEEMIKAKSLETRDVAIEEYVTDPQAEPDTAKWLTNIYYMLK